jgi:CheY-like chemotaxis protein
VAAELRADPLMPRVPIVMMTAHAYGAVGRRARDVGCNGFLAKPCDPTRVLAEVERHVAA